MKGGDVWVGRFEAGTCFGMLWTPIMQSQFFSFGIIVIRLFIRNLG